MNTNPPERGWVDFRPSLSSRVLKLLVSQGFSTPTPVQTAAIQPFLSNKDVAVQAVTGSGKTLAFVIPLVEILISRKLSSWRKHETGGLVLLPTRELASQVAEVLQHFLPSHLSLLLLIGGTEVAADVHIVNTKGANIVVGTPGRVADLLSRRDCQLAAAVRSLEVLVLDEADRLLELGFEQTLNTILSYLPKQRRTGLFSATLPQQVQDFVRAGLRNPVTIVLRDAGCCAGTMDELATPNSLDNYYLECDPQQKLACLMRFLSHHREEKVIVFFATCASVSYFATLVQRLLPSVPVLALHGRMHKKRQKLFDKFLAISSGVLISTDVMSRGVDVPDVDWVVQFDPPSAAQVFVHRCGRTARMGRRGSAVVFLLPSELAYVEFLQINQRTLLLPLPSHFQGDESSFSNCVEEIRDMAIHDRDLYDSGIRAFVSFIRFYRKHECLLIFQFKALDLAMLAYHTFALLHVPKMQELRGKDLSPFPSHPICPADIPYISKRARKQAEAQKTVKAKKNAERRQRKTLWKQIAQEKKKRKKAKKKKLQHLFTDGELEELAREARLLKKFKAGKITKEELDKQL